MNRTENRIRKRDLLIKPLIAIIILSGVSIVTFQHFHQRWISSLTEMVEEQHRQNISQIVHVARNTIEPHILEYREGKINREQALRKITATVRTMKYRDQYGNNYVFMSSYSGKMLVQPFEPEREGSDQWDLRDLHGLYIIRELVRAAQTRPEGSFVKYYYYLPGVHAEQEKLAYVMGIPELHCYIGTGMYMNRAILAQKDILKRVNLASIWFFIAILIPLSAAILFILNRNRLLLNEINVRESVEEELKKSEEKYRSIFENIPQGIFQTSTDGRFISANRTLARMYGYDSPEEMLEKTYNIGEQYYADPEQRKVFLELMEKNGHVEKFITRFKRQDGAIFWGSNNSRAVTDETGRVLYYEGAIEDITTLVEAEANARLAEEKFSKVFLTSPEGIVITRLEDGKLIDVNPGFEKITGWSRDEITGLTTTDINFWDDISSRQEMLDSLKDCESVLYREFRFRNRERELRAGLYSVRSIEISGEECLVFVMQDTTEKLRMEEEQRRLEQQLFQSQKMDAIGKLAGGVAHDFNNILTGVQGLVSLLKIKLSSDEQSGSRLTKIEEQVSRGAGLTRQLLNLAREEKNEKKIISVNALVKKSTSLFKETRKGIEIDLDIEDNPLPVEADPGQMEQVLLNLYINADHAMPDGGSISIKTSNVTIVEQDAHIFDITPGDYVRISVTDTGTGMDNETLKRIFEPFFTTKSEQGGSGLGLASAYGIVRNHGGIINAYSEPGEGSTFNIHLPLTLKSINDDTSLPERTIFYGNGNILVIDDEKSILESASEMLSIMGYTVLQAESGNEAINIYREKTDSIDLVILDMIMPGMSGSQVLKSLREINPDAKIILSSGYILKGNSMKVIEHEYSSFIQKPYSFMDLSSVVHEAINS